MVNTQCWIITTRGRHLRVWETDDRAYAEACELVSDIVRARDDEPIRWVGTDSGYVNIEAIEEIITVWPDLEIWLERFERVLADAAIALDDSQFREFIRTAAEDLRTITQPTP